MGKQAAGWTKKEQRTIGYSAAERPVQPIVYSNYPAGDDANAIWATPLCLIKNIGEQIGGSVRMQ